MEIGNEITFFIDPKIDNEFMVDAANDLQCVMDKKVNIIKHQVIKLISLHLDWNTMNYDLWSHTFVLFKYNLAKQNFHILRKFIV